MFPILTIDDADNRRCGDPELVSEHLMGVGTLGVQFPDAKDIGFCQLGPEMGLSTRGIDGPMPAPVKLVAARGIPSEVGQEDVGGDAIVVAALQPPGARPDKGEQDKDVNTGCNNFTVPTQGHLRVSGTFDRAKYFLGRGRYLPLLVFCGFALGKLAMVRSDSSGIRDFVPFKTFNRQPSLLNIIGDCVTFLSIHGGNLLDRFLLWQSRVRCFPQPPGLSFYTTTSDVLPGK
jgi:hypothetical protein